MLWPEAAELHIVEQAIDAALFSGNTSALRILGYGEISSVVAATFDAGDFACKRLPLFDTPARLDAYRQCSDDYLAALTTAGVQVWPTVVRVLTRPDDERLAAYCVQPVLPADELLPAVFAQTDEANGVALFTRVRDTLLHGVGPRLGIDGQLSNWALHDGELVYLDVSTPMLRDADGREALDTDLFIASLPWLLRGLVRRFMLGDILDKYYEPRGVILDLLGNLYKERLERLVEPLRALANERLSPAISAAEVLRYYRADARMWALLQRLRRLDRAWQRVVRRRVYPFLLPGRIERHV